MYEEFQLSNITHRKAGQVTIVGPRQNFEADTATCYHCNRCWVVRSTDRNSKSMEADPGGFCRLCMKMICPTCTGKECVPFEKKLQLYESRKDLFKKMGLEL